MNDQRIEDGKAAMRGLINTYGIEASAVEIADELAGPMNADEHYRIIGFFLAAFEAGMSHQIARTR